MTRSAALLNADRLSFRAARPAWSATGRGDIQTARYRGNKGEESCRNALTGYRSQEIVAYNTGPQTEIISHAPAAEFVTHP